MVGSDREGSRLPGMERTGLRDHIAAAILDAAARVLAEQGETASMAAIASASGVGRATLYRYFPNRDALVAGLVERVLEALGTRIADAGVDGVPVPEGLARVTRAFLAEGREYAALVRIAGVHEHKRRMGIDDGDERISGPVRSLLARGAADGTLRPDVPEDVRFEMFTALVERALTLVITGRMGVEEAGALATGVFLDGFRARPA